MNLFPPPHADEKPAGVENTFLLCPAPVVDEVGKYVDFSVYSNKHLALLARFHVQLGSRSFHTQKHMFGCVRLWPQGTRRLPCISFFYNPYPWPHSTSLIPSTTQQNVRDSVAAVPSFVLPLSSIKKGNRSDCGSAPLISHPISFSLAGMELTCLLQLLNIRSPHHFSRSLWTLLSGAAVAVATPPPTPPLSVTTPLRYLPFICLSFNPHRSPAHSQQSACPASGDQSQEAARESFKHAVCFSAGWKIPEKRPINVWFNEAGSDPQAVHRFMLIHADWTAFMSTCLIPCLNIHDSMSCSLTAKLHHFIRNIIPTCVLSRLLLFFV